MTIIFLSVLKSGNGQTDGQSGNRILKIEFGSLACMKVKELALHYELRRLLHSPKERNALRGPREAFGHSYDLSGKVC
jgi:hypothetical protein